MGFIPQSMSGVGPSEFGEHLAVPGCHCDLQHFPAAGAGGLGVACLPSCGCFARHVFCKAIVEFIIAAEETLRVLKVSLGALTAGKWLRSF